jgi:TRAP-type C4-dicarboxylate transport system permease small subunit
VAQVQEIWNKLNPRERLVAAGSAVVVVAWLVGLVTYFGYGLTTLALLAAIASLVILYLKYAPNTNITWPAPVSLILVVLGGLAALFVLIDFLRELSFLTATDAITGIAFLVGAGLMAWGGWQEYSIEKPAMPSFGSGTSSTPPSSTPPPAAPTAPPPAAPAADDTDEAPPA